LGCGTHANLHAPDGRPGASRAGLWRTDLQHHDLSVPGREVIQNRVDIFPEAPAVRHWHPGEEVIFVLDGTLEYDIEGQEPQTVSAGQALTVPAETTAVIGSLGRQTRSHSLQPYATALP
jgi:quercetin dioxygenase-like cupin family protein